MKTAPHGEQIASSWDWSAIALLPGDFTLFGLNFTQNQSFYPITYDFVTSQSKDIWVNSKNEENDGELDQEYEEIIASHGIVLSKKPTSEQKAKDSTNRLRFESIMSEVRSTV